MALHHRSLTTVWTLVELLSLVLGLGMLSVLPRLTSARGQLAVYREQIGELEGAVDAAARIQQDQAEEAVAWQEKLRTSDRALAGLRRDLDRYVISREQLRQERDRLRQELAQQRVQQQRALQAELAVRKELVDLRGELGRTVFVVDRSMSMAYPRPGVSGGDNPWQQVHQVVETWVNYLPVREARLIVFSTEVEVFPAAPELFLALHGEQGAANRRRLLNHLAALRPGGATNTLAALQQAYRCPGVDTIVLFTDGAPNLGGTHFDPRAAAAVLALCRQHGKSVPVNVVALGDYFQPQLASFLLNITDISGGVFIGR